MKSFKSIIKLPTAVQERNQFDLSQSHYTTNDFFRYKPVYIHEVVPGEELHIDMQTFSRTAPLWKPFFGNVEFINRAFFVPCRTIMNGWNEFITDTLEQNATKKNFVPYITNADLVNLFKNNTDYGWYNSELHGEADFSQGNDTKKVLTRKGKVAYDILRNLGYHINYSNAHDDDGKYNALPLLAFWRIYADWLRNPAFQADLPFTLKRDGEYHVSDTDLKSMFDHLENSLYEKDYFTSAWVRPTGPNNTAGISSMSFEDITNDQSSGTTKSFVKSSSNPGANIPTTPVLVGSSNGSSANNTIPAHNLSQYALDKLKQLTDYVKRFQLVGEKALDRYAAMFGIELSSAKLDRSQYIGTNKMSMNIGEVMSNADTEGEALGEYAGKSSGYGNGQFHLKSDEFGYFIIISVVRPHIGYAQGRPRNISHLNRNDFFNPTWDGLGTQPIRVDELFADNFTHDELPTDYYPNGVFGFTSTYAEYKCQPSDCLSGDFVLNSRNTGLDCYHMLRMFKPTDTFKVSRSFTIGETQQFDRVFNYAADDGQWSDYDHFFTVYHFKVSAWLPMSKMFEDYDFDGGRLIAKEVGGTSLE